MTKKSKTDNMKDAKKYIDNPILDKKIEKWTKKGLKVMKNFDDMGATETLQFTKFMEYADRAKEYNVSKFLTPLVLKMNFMKDKNMIKVIDLIGERDELQHEKNKETLKILKQQLRKYQKLSKEIKNENK
jgi:hypothetical protein